jgi:hypothetical protein
MRRLRMLALAIALATLGFVPTAGAKDQHAAFELHLEVPNVARASNGDTLAVTGMGAFAVHPKSVTASGTFIHTFARGGSASGAWTATDLLSFHFYGCGAIPSIDATLPPNLCGGALKMRVMFTPAGAAAIPGMITVFCVIGEKAPPTHDNPTQPGEEGMTAVLPGVANFNKIVSGMNVYVRTA